ncbi:hypothetical protein [Dipodfec virus UOA04_Rod_765]|nr:hypothetical protein [Dipodfec virus UOA04_Rod_765]
MKEFTYRYFWQPVDWQDESGDKLKPLRTALLSGPEETHASHIRFMLEDSSICNFSREYVCEYDIDLVGKFEPTAELKLKYQPLEA